MRRFTLPALLVSTHFFLLTLLCPATVALAAKDKDNAAAATVTYNKDIASILWKNCAGCHRPGEVGPFSLLTYKDTAKRADHIAEITAERRMPPWKPEPGFGKFHDERRLSDGEIAKLAQWAKEGAPEGNAKDLPKPPTFPEGWQLGEPDVIVKMSDPFVVPASGRDIYRCFVIPIPIDRSRSVSAVEFRPGNRRVVHHAILYLDANGQARKKDGGDGKPGYSTFGGPGIIPTGGLGGWAPGAMPRFLPDGLVKFLKKDSDLVLQIHYHPDGKEETDQSQVGIYFTKQPVRKIVTGIAVMQRDLNLPAGKKDIEVDAESEPLPVNVSVLGVGPHMHNLGREFKVTAKVPEEEEELPLIWIKDWDFNWQGSYQFAEPVELPKGSVIKVHAVYDNSAENPRNPNNPPKDVRWGEQTTDEMLLCGVQVYTDKIADLKLVAAMRGNELGAALDGGIPALAESVKKKVAARAEVAKKVADKKAAAKPDDKAEPKPEETAPAVPDPAVPDPAAVATENSGEGHSIPEKFKANLEKYDLNKDGKLTKDEMDKMPAQLRQRMEQVFSGNVPKRRKR